MAPQVTSEYPISRLVSQPKMAPRKEILDSDEEDDDFSPVKTLADPPRLEESNDHEHDSYGAPRTRRAESTDPSFFRNVYDEQHVALPLHHKLLLTLLP